MSNSSVAQTRERYLRHIDRSVQEAELLELEADAKSRAKDPDVRKRGIEAGHAAIWHRQTAQRFLIFVTNHTDYSEPSDHADERFLQSLEKLSYECRPTDSGQPSPMPQDPRFPATVASMAA